MKLIDILVRELPVRGGWPEGIEEIWQDYDRLMVPLGWFHNELSDDHRRRHNDAEVKINRRQYEAALAASKKEWDGVGLPPVGCRVEYSCKQPDLGHPAIEAGKWYGGTIIAYHNECVWTSDNGIRHLSNTIFRPIRSDKFNNKYSAIEALFAVLDAGTSTSQDSIDIYDAIAAGKIPGVKLEG